MRVEDLDTARCKTEYIDSLFRDFEWLGLTWEGQVVYQSRRNDLYEEAFNCLVKQDLVYPCYCSRADLHAASAPHSGEEVIYPGTCRNLTEKERISKGRFKDPSFRIKVNEATYSFKDYFQGSHSGSLPKESGDFIIRRSDGIFAYQLAVVCDDEEMGITSVVRGCDLLVYIFVKNLGFLILNMGTFLSLSMLMVDVLQNEQMISASSFSEKNQSFPRVFF